jgi:hypothetical protein
VALLRIERSRGASLISLLAAIPRGDIRTTPREEVFVLDDDFAAYFSDEPLPSAVREEVARGREEGKVTTVLPRTIPLAS